MRGLHMQKNIGHAQLVVVHKVTSKCQLYQQWQKVLDSHMELDWKEKCLNHCENDNIFEIKMNTINTVIQ